MRHASSTRPYAGGNLKLPLNRVQCGIMGAFSLVHHFLIAMPDMGDPNFSRSLTYICEHSEVGALGIIVNRPTDMTISTLLERTKAPKPDYPNSFCEGPVYFGGPVQSDHGFVLHRPVGTWENTIAIRDDMALTFSRDILHSMSSSGTPRDMILALGYAGWGPQQLEHEILQNGWLTVPAQPDLIFNLPPEQRFNAAMGLLGINPANLVAGAGRS